MDFSLIYSTKHQSTPASNFDKEKLQEENLQLKSILNNLRKELAAAKSENHKKELEMNKKDKVIEDIAIEYGGSSGIYGALSSPDLYNKAKEANIVIKMKKQYKELKNELKGKCEEIENLKKLVKVTKYNELALEIKTLTEELNKIKTLYIHSLKQNENGENNLKELQSLQDNFSKQHFLIVSLNDNIGKLNEDIKSKEQDISKLREISTDRLEQTKKLKKDLLITTQSNDLLIKERQNKTESNLMKAKYESQINEITKEMNRYKDIAERRDRQVRELESNIKKITTHENKKENTFNYNEIKFIQDNPEEKYDNITLLLKSKLQEQISEKDKLKRLNKLFEKKIEIYEKELGYTINDEVLKEEFMLVDNTPQNENIDENDNINENLNENEEMNSEKVNSNNTNLNENENEENDPLKSNYFTEDQLTEFTYILIKNFEAKKLSKPNANDKIIKEIFTSSPSSKSQIKEILSKIANKINSVLNLKLEDDKKRIAIFVQTLFSLSGKELDVFKDKFLSLFYNVKVYTEDEEVILGKKLKKYLIKHLDYLKKVIGQSDVNKTGYITFINLRKILESINLRLKDKYIEYLIYKMKSFEDTTGMPSIYDLKYKTMYDVIENAENEDSKNITSEEEEDDDLIRDATDLNEDKDDSEIVITTDQFNEKINTFLKNMHNYLKSNKLTIREFFKGEIFKPNQISIEDVFKNIPDEAVDLKIFLDRIKNIGITMTNLDVYCIYTKFKILDDFEAISLSKLEKELSGLIVGSNTFSSEISAKNEDNLPQVNEDEEDFSKYSFDNLENEQDMNSGFISNSVQKKGVTQIEDVF